jgi:hypothetical protein
MVYFFLFIARQVVLIIVAKAMKTI